MNIFCLIIFALVGNVQVSEIADLIETKCITCHDDDLKKGNLDLTKLEWEDLETLTLIHDIVKIGDMPPLKKNGQSRISNDERAMFVALLSKKIQMVQNERVTRSGRAQMRRLNRQEYENTLRDLLELPIVEISDHLPPDGRRHGFDKVGSALDLSHIHLETYLEAVESVLTNALKFPEQKPAPRTMRSYANQNKGMLSRLGVAKWDRWWIALKDLNVQNDKKNFMKYRKVPVNKKIVREKESIAVFRGAKVPHDYFFDKIKIPFTGKYKLSIKARSVIRQTEMATFPGGLLPPLIPNGKNTYLSPRNDKVFAGKRHEPVALYAAYKGKGYRLKNKRYLGCIKVPPLKPQVMSIEAVLEMNETIAPDAIRLPKPMVPAIPLKITQIDPDGYPGIAFHWIEVKGPIIKVWPPKAYSVMFDQLPYNAKDWRTRRVEVLSDEPHADGVRLIDRFMRRVLHHRYKSKHAEPFKAYFKNLINQKTPFVDAIISTYAGILTSPQFLFINNSPGPLSPEAQTERLGLFLSNSKLDTGLMSLVEKKKNMRTSETLYKHSLESSDKKLLNAQVDYLINSPNIDRFVQSFTDQWLKLDQIYATDPDPDLFPNYTGDDWLIMSMIEETRSFFKDMIARNAPIRELIDSDTIFVNEILAKHYGIKGVTGPAIRQISLPKNSPYGGLMTQASILKITADGTTTSPITRGIWVAETLMGVHIPKPPANLDIPEIDIRDATTVREIIEKHSTNTSCANCHSKFDSYGFALENFDVMGKWYENYRTNGMGQKVTGIGRGGHLFTYYVGREIDASHQLPSGEKFADIRGLKKLLIKKERQIARNLAYKLITYATGAEVQLRDRAEVEKILDISSETNYGITTIIHEVVNSLIFRNK